jgi:hypothetical protein
VRSPTLSITNIHLFGLHSLFLRWTGFTSFGQYVNILTFPPERIHCAGASHGNALVLNARSDYAFITLTTGIVHTSFLSPEIALQTPSKRRGLSILLSVPQYRRFISFITGLMPTCVDNLQFPVKRTEKNRTTFVGLLFATKVARSSSGKTNESFVETDKSRLNVVGVPRASATSASRPKAANFRRADALGFDAKSSLFLLRFCTTI